ncbi:hypothetical protein Tco_0378081 [Tanacetum coccineum]
MTTPDEKRNHAKFCEFHDEIGIRAKNPSSTITISPRARSRHPGDLEEILFRKKVKVSGQSQEKYEKTKVTQTILNLPILTLSRGLKAKSELKLGSKRWSQLYEIANVLKMTKIGWHTTDLIRLIMRRFPSNPLPNGKILEVQGERPEKDLRSLACIKADEKKLDDIRVVRDFPKVFPDDLLGASPVVRSPYRLAPSEMLELSNQLKELQEKGFIRTQKEDSNQRPSSVIELDSWHFEFTVMPIGELTNATTALFMDSMKPRLSSPYLDKFRNCVHIDDILQFYSKVQEEESEVHQKTILTYSRRRSCTPNFQSANLVTRSTFQTMWQP